MIILVVVSFTVAKILRVLKPGGYDIFPRTGFTVAKILRVLKLNLIKSIPSSSFTVAKILRVLKLEERNLDLGDVLQ